MVVGCYPSIPRGVIQYEVYAYSLFFKPEKFWNIYASEVLDVGLWPALHVHSVSCVQLFVDPGTVAHEALLSMPLSRQEYWSGLPFPSAGDLPDPRTDQVSCISCNGRRILYRWATWESHGPMYTLQQIFLLFLFC